MNFVSWSQSRFWAVPPFSGKPVCEFCLPMGSKSRLKAFINGVMFFLCLSASGHHSLHTSLPVDLFYPPVHTEKNKSVSPATFKRFVCFLKWLLQEFVPLQLVPARNLQSRTKCGHVSCWRNIAYQFLRAGRDILCFLTPVSEQRYAFLPPFSL